uniref:Uncharacterized protein n=1 Tax=Vitis vinifera TaxID=29760 RepID=F6HFQ5_VITVI
MEKAYPVFLCVLLISVLFLPSTAAGRALLQTAQTEGESGNHGGNDGSKMGVPPSHSSTAPSRTGVSSPSKPTPGRISYDLWFFLLQEYDGKGFGVLLISVLFLPSTAAERALPRSDSSNGGRGWTPWQK